jgi:hypothetical protein
MLLGVLSRADSIVLAGAKIPDGRDVAEAGRRNREQMRDAMRRRGAVRGEIVASERQGGCCMDVFESGDLL